MQDILTLLTVSAAVVYLFMLFALPSIKRERAPDVPLVNLLRKARATRKARLLSLAPYSVSPRAKRS